MTAHWVSNSFEKSSAVLHVTALEESHTGSYICTKFNDMLSAWKISKENVHVVLRDNASNMGRAMKDADLSSYGCFAHSLQLVVNDGVLSQRIVTDLLATCRSIVGHFQRSTVAYDKLKQIQQQLDVTQHTLKRDEPTRWNSSLYMLQSIVEQKMCLAAYGSDSSIPVLTDIANKVINVLLPVEEITKCISEDTTCISVIISLVRGLKKTLEQSDEDRGVRTMKSEMLESLQRRFSNIEETDFLVLSTMLDPRFKDKFFSSSAHEHAKVLLKEVYEVLTEDEPGEPEPKRIATEDSNSKLWGCLSEILTESDVVDLSTGNEIEQYLSEPLIDLKSGDPYKWWKQHSSHYSVLSKLARKYLGAPPTSVHSERLFSGAGEIYGDRSCLKPELVEDLLIKYNLPMIGNSYRILGE